MNERDSSHATVSENRTRIAELPGLEKLQKEYSEEAGYLLLA